MSTTPYFPPSPRDELARLYVGKSIRNVPMPAAVLDVAVARTNCDRMLAACKSLDLSWRAHVKTHKVCSTPRDFLRTETDLTRRSSSPNSKLVIHPPTPST
jgi:D-serine ammonia-lyase